MTMKVFTYSEARQNLAKLSDFSVRHKAVSGRNLPAGPCAGRMRRTRDWARMCRWRRIRPLDAVGPMADQRAFSA
jgi:hypothetical protein